MRDVERPNVYAENLLGAGKRYGDAKLALDRNLGLSSASPEWKTLVSTAREAESALHSAARAYATRMRRKKPVIAPETGKETE